MGKRGALSGERNPFWKGGRTLASTGYWLVRVGKNHPLADVRGYAYEHRLVAFAKIGRALRPGEVVHHRDGNKRNNEWANIEVLPSRHHHAREHSRKKTSRAPGETNLAVACACGCGRRLLRYDAGGRPRRFISGHNARRSA